MNTTFYWSHPISEKKETEKKIQATTGKTQHPGVRKQAKGYEFTIEVPPGKKASLLLYEQSDTTLCIPFLEESRRGGLLSLAITGISGEIHYNFQIEDQIVQDSYARFLCHTSAFGEPPGEKLCCGYREERFQWEDQGFQPEPLSDSVLYKLQVRSFTMHKNSKVRKKGTFQGLEQKIPYFKELGITGILLMPAYEYRETMNAHGAGRAYHYAEAEQKINCWGYTGKACYFAPKAGFCASRNPVQEFKHMVNALHKAGLECLMEFYFDGSTAPSVMLDLLRYWKMEYHIDGFHLMGMGICQEVFLGDALLSDSKLLFHDVENLPSQGKQHKPYFKNAAEYNEGFLYGMRHILKGDENMVEEFLYRNKRNSAYSGVINYMADQDGFTMMDMVSYEERHNEANGEKNQDGMEYNCSWNCGAEGNSRKQSIQELRLRQLKNAFSLLLFSQGTPLIFQGDEWGNSQGGNNNVWCQDNETGWINWRGVKTNQKLLNFVKEAIRFRKEHKILHMEEELKGVDYRAFGYPDISYHGTQAWYLTRESHVRSFGILYCQDYGGRAGEFLFVAYNFHWVPHELALPGRKEEVSWRVVMRTDSGFYEEGAEIQEKTIEVPSRTIIILAGKQDEKLCGSGSTLKRLQSTSF